MSRAGLAAATLLAATAIAAQWLQPGSADLPADLSAAVGEGAPQPATLPRSSGGSGEQATPAALSALPLLQPIGSARLPVPPGAPSAHAASLAWMADPARPGAPDGGRLLAVWWAGSRESGPDVRVYLSELGPNGWQTPRAVADRESLGRALGFSVRRIGNAVLHPAPDGRLHLFVVATGLGGWAAARVVHLVAAAPERPFEVQRVLPLTPLANTSMLVRAQTVPLADGGWWLPAYFEIGLKYPVLLSFDARGELRSIVRIGRSTTSLQPTLVPLPDGGWRALMRDHGPQRRIQVADSVDGGRHWIDSPALPLSSHDTAPAATALRARDGTLAGYALAYNDTAGAGSTPRSVLRLALSADGRTWQPGPDVQRAEPGAEFSYPNLLQVGERLHVVYTHRRDGIAHQVFGHAAPDAAGPITLPAAPPALAR
jgi:predicted neuraminidase